MDRGSQSTTDTETDAPQNPIQLKNGFTRIANPILEALAMAGFSGGQLRILLVLIRHTYGFQQKDERISYAEFQDDADLASSTVMRAMKTLVQEGVIVRSGNGGPLKANRYRLQKDPRKWGAFACEPQALKTLLEGDEGVEYQPALFGGGSPADGRGGSPADGRGGSPADGRSSTPQVVGMQGDSDPLKIVYKDKERYTTWVTDGDPPPADQLRELFPTLGDLPQPNGPGTDREYPGYFEATWDAYPDRDGPVSKAEAYRKWRATVIRGAHPQQVLDGVESYAEYKGAKGDAGTRYVKRPMTFFGPTEPWADDWTVTEAVRQEGKDKDDDEADDGYRYDRAEALRGVSP